jgi:hypothetical protein
MCESLPFRPYKSSDFKWTSNSDKDDWVGLRETINRTIMLRAEQMDEDWWWCRAYLNEYDVYEGHARTEMGAKRMALIGLNKYLKSQW